MRSKGCICRVPIIVLALTALVAFFLATIPGTAFGQQPATQTPTGERKTYRTLLTVHAGPAPSLEKTGRACAEEALKEFPVELVQSDHEVAIDVVIYHIPDPNTILIYMVAADRKGSLPRYLRHGAALLRPDMEQKICEGVKGLLETNLRILFYGE